MRTVGEVLKDFEKTLEGLQRLQAGRMRGFEVWFEQQPREIKCERHAKSARVLSRDRTWQQCCDVPNQSWRPQYDECAECREEGFQQWRLGRCGVPEVLRHCTLENWKPRNGAEREHLEKVRQFADEVRKGFLLLLGPVGVGKSHLAVGVICQFLRSDPRLVGVVFIKQSALLRRLRATYRDPKADDPIQECQEASLLIIDEFGVSAGGRDEGPMIHEILDHRYAEKKPTLMTSNLTWDELRSELGERLADRMKEACYKVLTFSSPSHRPTQRKSYFGKAEV